MKDLRCTKSLRLASKQPSETGNAAVHSADFVLGLQGIDDGKRDSNRHLF